MTPFTSSAIESNKEGGERKVVHFDSSIDFDEEARRTARGVELRQNRKEHKKMVAHNRAERIEAIVRVLRNNRLRPTLVRLCGLRAGRNTIMSLITAFLNEFVDQDDSIEARLTAFSRLPLNRITRLEEYQKKMLEALEAIPTFHDAFAASIPSHVISTASEESDSPGTRRRATLRSPRSRRVRSTFRQNVANANARQALNHP